MARLYSLILIFVHTDMNRIIIGELRFDIPQFYVFLRVKPPASLRDVTKSINMASAVIPRKASGENPRYQDSDENDPLMNPCQASSFMVCSSMCIFEDRS